MRKIVNTKTVINNSDIRAKILTLLDFQLANQHNIQEKIKLEIEFKHICVIYLSVIVGDSNI